jgi:hypothetical protein
MGDLAGSFVYTGPDGRPLQQDSCGVTVAPEATLFVPSRGSPLAIDLGDVTAIEVGDVELTVTLHTSHTLTLQRFGRGFDTLRHDLIEAWRTRLVACLLLQDLEELARFDGVVRQDGSLEDSAPAEIRVYRSNLAVLPSRGTPFQWRLADIDDVQFDRETWDVKVASSSGRIVVSKLARRTEEFTSCLDHARHEVARAGIAALAACLSPLGPDALRRVASMWRDGQPVRIDQLETIDRGLESALMYNAVDADLRPYVDALRARARGVPFVGFTVAREMDEGDPSSADDQSNQDADIDVSEAGNVIFWFLYRLADDVMAWETASRSGRATYVFRLSPFAEGPGASREAEGADPDAAVQALTRALAVINFRRMPIYLSDDALQAARFRRYRVASRRVPAVARLRRAFVGRAVHGKTDEWAARLDTLVGEAGA